jgi:hypothetical protein
MTYARRYVTTALFAVAGTSFVNAALTGCQGSAASTYLGANGGSPSGSGSTATTTTTAGTDTGSAAGGSSTSTGGSASTTGPDTSTDTNTDAGTPTGTGTGSDTGTPTGTDTGMSTSSSSGTPTGMTSGTTTSTGTTSTGTTSTGTTAGTGTGTTPAWGTPVAGGPTGMGVTATVTVSPGMTVGNVGSNFVGFSYEKTHITNDSLNSTNKNLVALYKLIGSPPIRLGADDVEKCNWGGTGPAPTTPSGEGAMGFSRTITTGMVDDLCSFLGATGGKIMYGLNYKSDMPTADGEEAAYAQGKCGSSIIGFEIGNEINQIGAWATLKPQWESIATAVVATPGAMLVGPAAGGGNALSLATPFAADESAKFGSKLVLLTMHYYAGTAGKADAVAATLQTPDRPGTAPTSQDGLIGTDSTMNAAATANKIPMAYRLGEVNTFSGHGQMGVSDSLIAGLWVLDMMFVTAENGGSGVNLHGGEIGMDGSNNFYYEPIMETNGVVVQVQPDYYGMLLFTLAGAGPVLSTSVTTSNPNFTAYTIKANGFVSVVLDNKNATSGVNAMVNMGAAVNSASAIYLQGTPAGDLTAPATAVTVAGAPVSIAGVWNRNPPYTQTTSGNTVSVYVPPASAALVHVLE